MVLFVYNIRKANSSLNATWNTTQYKAASFFLFSLRLLPTNLPYTSHVSVASALFQLHAVDSIACTLYSTTWWIESDHFFLLKEEVLEVCELLFSLTVMPPSKVSFFTTTTINPGPQYINTKKRMRPGFGTLVHSGFLLGGGGGGGKRGHLPPPP